MEAAAAGGRVPVTVLTGTLGAGKTTTLRGLLHGSHGRRIAVIENEFGDERGIERLIAHDADGATVNLGDLFVELSNGCVCCAVKDDLVTTLEGLLERSDKFDQIVIETSGVADPGPLAGIFWLDEALESSIFLDGIVAVVDAKNLERNLDDPRKQKGSGVINEAVKQLAYADRIVLNKRDTVDSAALEQVKKRIQDVNPLADVREAQFGDVEAAFVLDVRGYSTAEETSAPELSSLQQLLLSQERQTSCDTCTLDTPCPGHAHDHEAGGAGTDAGSKDAKRPSRHDDTVTSLVVRLGQIQLKKGALEAWLGQLLWEPKLAKEAPAEIFRVKGIVYVAESEHVHVVQGVHETFEIDATKELWGGEAFPKRETRIVFIGRHLDLDALTKGVLTARA